MTETILKVNGMTCGGCQRSVENGLARLPGVRSVQVDLKAGTAKVQHEPGRPDLATFEAAIFDAGYDFGGVVRAG